jgi:hypothetical protein
MLTRIPSPQRAPLALRAVLQEQEDGWQLLRGSVNAELRATLAAEGIDLAT